MRRQGRTRERCDARGLRCRRRGAHRHRPREPSGFGIPEAFARVLGDSDRGIARGELFTDSGDLGRLIGRTTTPPREAVAAALWA